MDNKPIIKNIFDERRDIFIEMFSISIVFKIFLHSHHVTYHV